MATNEAPSIEDTEDADPRNMYVRAGYLYGLASRLDGEDRVMVQRAARSLCAMAEHLDAQPRKEA